MNIFKREMKANRKALILWCIGILFMIAAGMGKYAGFQASGQSMDELMNLFPKEMLSIFGIGALGMGTITSFYAIVYLCVVLMATIHAGMLGAGIIAKEERDKTSEFLYVKPVSRSSIITSKVLAAIVNVVIINLVSLATSIAVVGKINKGEDFTGDILLMTAAMFILQILFLFIGTGLAALSRKPRSAASRVSAIILAAYILDVVINMNEKLGWLTFISPFKYFDAESVMISHKLDFPYVLLSMAIILIFSFVTYVFYKKKDLSI